MQNWNVTKLSDQKIEISSSSGKLLLSGCEPIVTAGQKQLTPTTVELSNDSLCCRFEDTIIVEQHFSQTDAGHLVLSTKVKNISQRPVSIDQIIPLSCAKITSETLFTRNLVNSKDMVGVSKLNSDSGCYKSYYVSAFTSADGESAMVCGFSDLSDAFYRFDFAMNDGITDYVAVCEREGIELAGGCELEISPLILFCGSSMSKLMDEYAAMVAKNMGYRNSNVETGWCSWYYYYDQATEKDIWENVNAMAGSEFSDKVRVIQIDDGWNLPSCDAPRVWGDWYAGGMFPYGMKNLADGIKEKGFVPGLWLAPFSVDPASSFYKQNPDLLVQKDGKPLSFWGVSALDLSNPAAIDFVKQTFDRVFNEWGFDYIKIDFLLHAVLPGERYDNAQTSATLLRKGLSAIRQIAGDRYILCCGCPMGPAVGICDAMRVGYDVSSRWDVKVNIEDWPLGNLNIRAAAIQSGWRQWTHKRWWQNDPDCILTRDYGSEPEKKMFADNFPQFKDSPQYGLSETEASCWSQFVWFTGGLAMLSENMAQIKGARRKMLVDSFPPNPDIVRWVDYYHSEDVIVLSSLGSKTMVGVFNFSEHPADIRIPASRLNMPDKWAFIERLSKEVFTGSGQTIEFPLLEPRSGKVWILQ